MTYATRTELVTRHGADEVEQREAALPPGATDRALTDADALINGYCAGRYAVPLAPVPDNVPRLACAIARYYLLGDANTDQSRQDYEDAAAWLKDVAAGRVILVEAGAAATTAVAAKPTSRTTTRQFDGDSLANYG